MIHKHVCSYNKGRQVGAKAADAKATDKAGTTASQPAQPAKPHDRIFSDCVRHVAGGTSPADGSAFRGADGWGAAAAAAAAQLPPPWQQQQQQHVQQQQVQQQYVQVPQQYVLEQFDLDDEGSPAPPAATARDAGAAAHLPLGPPSEDGSEGDVDYCKRRLSSRP